jgi:hypothetical protein
LILPRERLRSGFGLAFLLFEDGRDNGPALLVKDAEVNVTERECHGRRGRNILRLRARNADNGILASRDLQFKVDCAAEDRGTSGPPFLGMAGMVNC